MLAVGAFSPLDHFMGRRDYQSVLDSMRLANGHLFPIPVTLPVDPGPDIRLGQEIALRDAKNNVLALMVNDEIYPWDSGEMAGKVFGSRDPRHPMVAEMSRYGPTNISGRLRVLQLPPHYDASASDGHGDRAARRHGASQRRRLPNAQPAAPRHGATKRAVQELTARCSAPRRRVAGRRGSLPRVHLPRLPRIITTRSRCWRCCRWRALAYREVWHMLIRRNYGANHLIVDRPRRAGQRFGGQALLRSYDAQEMAARFSDELGVKPVPFKMLSTCPMKTATKRWARCRKRRRRPPLRRRCARIT